VYSRWSRAAHFGRLVFLPLDRRHDRIAHGREEVAAQAVAQLDARILVEVIDGVVQQDDI
jgi:hypothetical protein